nr:TlpA disulfide reductase family protein [uncultured Marinifilum sp.]
MRTLMFLLVVLSFPIQSMAQNVSISGIAPAYAGDNLTIKFHSEAFTYQEKTIHEFDINSDGSFSADFKIDQTQLFFIPLGVYKGFIYLEPGKKYEIKLPPKQELTPAQKLNPFFETEELMLGVANASKNDLNFLIRTLDDNLDSYINQNFHKIYRKKELSLGVEFSNQLKKQYQPIKNVYFKEYLKYRLGFLEFLANPNAFAKIENKYFLNQNFQTNNPAFLSLYKKQYGNFFNGYFKQKESVGLSKAFKSTDTYNQISLLMQKYPAYKNLQLRNIIIASSIFDSYTRKFIGKEKTLSVIKDILKSTTNAYNKKVCNNYIAKITHLQKNYPAPNFSIENHSLVNYKGKYLYLNFCNTQSYSCIQDFKEIEKLKQQFGKYVNFLSIACDWKEASVTKFLEKNNYSWPIIPIGNQHQLIHEYKVKAFPSYVLIDPKGNIVKAPAAGPKENIRMEFIKIVRDAAIKSNKSHHNK